MAGETMTLREQRPEESFRFTATDSHVGLHDWSEGLQFPLKGRR